MNSNRRDFIKKTAALGVASVAPAASAQFHQASGNSRLTVLDSFDRPDSLYHGSGWETQNPGYWQIKDGALRRRLKNLGDRARKTGFPFHSSKGSNPSGPGKMQVDYDPSLPAGILWRRNLKMTKSFSVQILGVFKAHRPSEIPEGDKGDWKMYSPGNGLMGIAIGGKGLFEGYQKANHPILVGWTDTEKPSLKLQGSGRKPKVKPESVQCDQPR